MTAAIVGLLIVVPVVAGAVAAYTAHLCFKHDEPELLLILTIVSFFPGSGWAILVSDVLT